MTAAATPTIAFPTKDGAFELRPMSFGSLLEKAQWLDAAASLDATDPRVRDLAAGMAKARGPNDTCGIATDLHDFVRDRITYVYGPGHQRFYSAVATLANGYGNCADKARLFVALCRSVEIEARILPIFTQPDEFSHVQAQVRCPGSDANPKADPGGWLRAELIAAGVRLGDGAEAVQYLPDGRIKLA